MLFPCRCRQRGSECSRRLVEQNGFRDGDPSVVVSVHIPPVLSQDFGGWNNHIEVVIDSVKGSIFGGIIGRAAWPVGTFAVAANEQGVTYRVGMLSLAKTACKAIAFAGKGTIETHADVQANSNGSEEGCGGTGFAVDGQATVKVVGEVTCRSVGNITGKPAQLDCLRDPFSFPLPDPLQGSPGPSNA